MVKRKSVSKKRVSKKRVSKRRSSKKRVSKKRVSKKRVSKKRVSKKRVSKKRVSKKRVSKKRVSKRRSSRKQKKKLLRGGGAEEEWCREIHAGRAPIERRQDVSDPVLKGNLCGKCAESYYTKKEFDEYYQDKVAGSTKYNSIVGSAKTGYICEADDEVRFNTKLEKWVTKDEFKDTDVPDWKAMWHASQQRDEANDIDDEYVPAPPPYASADAPPSTPKDVVLRGGERLRDFGVGEVINGVYNYNPVHSKDNEYGDVFTHIVKDVFDAATYGKEFHIFRERSGNWTIGNTKNLTGEGNIGLSTLDNDATHPASLKWQLKWKELNKELNITVDIAP